MTCKTFSAAIRRRPFSKKDEGLILNHIRKCSACNVKLFNVLAEDMEKLLCTARKLIEKKS